MYGKSTFPVRKNGYLLERFAFEIVALRQAKPAYANLADVATLRFAPSEHFVRIDSFNGKML